MSEKPKSTPTSSMDFDDMLKMCGDHGRYQIILLFLFGFVNLFGSMHYFAQTIVGFVPNHWCYHEKIEHMSFEDIENIYKNFDRPSCTKLDKVYSIDNVTKSNQPCTRWIYKYDYGYESMNTQLNWVCQNAYQASVGQSLFYVGSVSGTLLYGFLADKIGRLPVLIMSNLSGLVGDLLTTLTEKAWSYAMCRFVSGMAADTNIYLMQVIVIEYIKPEWRSAGLNIMIGIFFCIGTAGIPWLAIAVGNWRKLLYCSSSPLLLVTLFYLIVQESALWLLTQKKVDGAIKRLKKVAKINGKHVTDEQFEKFREYCELKIKSEENQRMANLIDMFKTPRLRRFTIILFYLSAVIVLSYDVVSRDMEDMGMPALLVFSLSALVIFPGSLVLVCFQNYLGRKGMASLAMLLAGIVTTITGIIHVYHEKRNPFLLLGLVSMARFSAAVSFDAEQQFAAELIPVCVRGQGVAVVHVVGFSASFLAPYIILLGKYFKAVPSIIVGTINLIGAFLLLCLPETVHKTLPTCVEDGEEFGKGEGLCTFVCCQRKSNSAKE